MASQARITANQKNAQRSTGPTTTAGRTNSSRNAVRHGLAARESTTLFSDPAEQQKFLAHKEALQNQLLPIGALEEKLVQLYAFSLFQAERAQFFELACDEIANMDRMARYGEVHERRAARTLNELRKLQCDRFAAAEVAQFINAEGEITPISAALPISKIRKSSFNKTNPIQIANTLIAADPEVQKRPQPDLTNEPDIDWLALKTKIEDK